jgi:hypothetical protein
MQSENTTVHFTPGAFAVLVKGFRSTEYPTAADIMTVDMKELSSVQVSLTTKNNPGTFSFTLSDTNNRFILPDEPTVEIPNLYARSHSTTGVQPVTTVGNTGSGSVPFNFAVFASTKYPFTDYDGDSQYTSWLNFEYGTLEDIQTGERFIVQYQRAANGTVVERYAIDNQGNFIFVVPNGSAQAETAFLTATSGSPQKYQATFDEAKSQTKPRGFILYKAFNSDFVTKYRDAEEQNTHSISTLSKQNKSTGFARGRCKISPMDRVMIFLPRRFDDNGNVNQTGQPLLIRSFVGLVNTAQSEYSENQNLITVSGEDVTKLMRLSVINMNPGVESADVIPLVNLLEGKATKGSLYTDESAPKVFEKLVFGGNVFDQTLTGIGEYVLGNITNSSTRDLDYNPDKNTFEAGSKSKFQRIVNEQSSLQDIGGLFEKSTVHIINPFATDRGNTNHIPVGFRDYALSMSEAWQLYNSEFQDRRAIAYKLAEDTHFEFFADHNGEIWFRPPRFNQQYILSEKYPQVYVVDTPSIISYGFVEDDGGVYSIVIATTEAKFGEAETALRMYQAYAQDSTALIKYGVRILETSNPIIQPPNMSNTDGKSALQMYARSLLQRCLTGKYQGQITITGRPELLVGRPVFVPCRNMIYYVETIDHALTFGGQFTTTLHLSYGRKPWEYLPDLPSFSSDDESYMTDGQIKSPTKTKAKLISQITPITPAVTQNQALPTYPQYAKDMSQLEPGLTVYQDIDTDTYTTIQSSNVIRVK